MKITTSEVNVNKELSQMQGNGYQLEDITSAVQRSYTKPRLMSALLNVQGHEEFMMTDTFKFDEVTSTLQLPEGKSYSDTGKDLKKDKPRELRYSIPSFGLKLQVSPQDYVGRRKVGTADEFLTEDDVLASLSVKAEDSWSALDELGIAELVTADTNIVRNGPFEKYNFYNDIVGSSRPAATDMDLGNGSIDHFTAGRAQRKIVLQELAKSGDSASQIIAICGDTYFNARFEVEKQEGLARELRGELDLASMAVPTVTDGNFMYDNFLSHDGILYVNYGSEIIAGTKLVDDDDAFLIPVGAQNLLRVAYAPANTRSYANTQALQNYGWSHVDERQGVTVIQESNKLFALTSPKSVVHLTTSTS